jgi:hypothetical protein
MAVRLPAAACAWVVMGCDRRCLPTCAAASTSRSSSALRRRSAAAGAGASEGGGGGDDGPAAGRGCARGDCPPDGRCRAAPAVAAPSLLIPLPSLFPSLILPPLAHARAPTCERLLRLAARRRLLLQHAAEPGILPLLLRARVGARRPRRSGHATAEALRGGRGSGRGGARAL